MMSSSAASAFRGGGAGAIHTDITVTTITRTITMDTAGTHTAPMDTADTATTVAPVMDIAMAAEAVTDTAMAADQGIPVLNIPAMRAIIIKEFGGPDSLVIENLPDPKPGKARR
jgi:hypothetical protein